ncbi:CAP domain-containing protein [Pseudofrankia inefficax]|uniref:SCP-like extracellular n=1 Tax=Pseudofrankia inefficax (strain DSM 45817 / CECT 9037 / DDB 130130 / EuI1c) TaxID=298654 RepID=E3JCT2_PSEI1|nr:CAP domain-containing protein [Pseudofrankia inefficax]ADP79922.1 SCP-like extracellular [Pseudofrankia inefficax]
MPLARRTVTGALAALGSAAVLVTVLAACKPILASSPPGGGESAQPTATVATSSPTAATSLTFSLSADPIPPPASPTTVAAPPSTAAQPPAQPPVRPAPPMTTRPPVTTRPPATTAPPAASKTDEVVRLTNVERAKAGCGALTVDARLAASAQAHTADMAQNNYFSHTSLDGRTMVDRIRATGFPLTAVGENIAAGGTTAAQTMDMWMNSPGHRANILNCSYTRIGVGYAEGGSYRYYWTQDFGRL